MNKVEDSHQIAYSRAVTRGVGIVGRGYRIGQIVAASCRQRRQLPICFYKLQYRSMVGVGMVDRAGLNVRRDHKHRNPGPITKKIKRLDITRVIVTSALVQCDDYRGSSKQFRLAYDFV